MASADPEPKRLQEVRSQAERVQAGRADDCRMGLPVALLEGNLLVRLNDRQASAQSGGVSDVAAPLVDTGAAFGRSGASPLSWTVTNAPHPSQAATMTSVVTCRSCKGRKPQTGHAKPMHDATKLSPHAASE